MIEYRKFITRDMLRTETDKLFVFGDNMKRYGMGGQAKEMRGEMNAVGIPTKNYPSMEEKAFFDSSDITYCDWCDESSKDIDRLLDFKGTIVWPSDGIGTGFAQLKDMAPRIWNYIEQLRMYLEAK